MEVDDGVFADWIDSNIKACRGYVICHHRTLCGNPKGEHRDYIAVRHPMGAVDSMHFFFFNQGDIENVVQKGVADEMHEKYVGLLNLTADILEKE